MAKINILPKHISDLIAAGEVVERPASIVKETVENSIDSGATFITVEIKNGGISYIRITDNGSGIEREYIRNAFISHATSKVLDAQDLDSIMTLGFRGEALASIAAVSKVEVMTKTKEDDVGVRYCIEGGEEILNDDAGCPNGTTIIIRDLFFNTPARMKFLKKDVTEANAVSAIMDRMALSHPEISFRFIRDGKETLLTHGDTKQISAIHSIFGNDFANGLIELNYELDNIKITGYISKPLNSRPNRSMQYFFINKRYVKSKTAFVALEEAYKNQIMVGKFPACILNIEMPFSNVDVNVHPSKLEVRFSNEKSVFNAVYYACLNAISNLDTRPTVDLSKISSKPTFVNPVRQQSSEQITFKSSQTVKPDNSFWKKQSVDEFKEEIKSVKTSILFSTDDKDSDLKNYYQSDEKNDGIAEKYNKIIDKVSVKEGEKVSETREEIHQREIKILGEAFKTYIFAQVDDKLIIVDKHAAHERILFDKLKKEADSSQRQILLSPVTVTLSKDEYSAVVDNIDLLEKSGYLVEDFGIGTVIVRECPLIIQKDDIESVVSEIAGYLLNNKNIIVPEKIDWIYHSSACRGAIKAGDNTNEYEMKKFIEKLLSSEDVRYCPHGRPVLIEMTKRELEKFFGRIV